MKHDQNTESYGEGVSWVAWGISVASFDKFQRRSKRGVTNVHDRRSSSDCIKVSEHFVVVLQSKPTCTGSAYIELFTYSPSLQALEARIEIAEMGLCN